MTSYDQNRNSARRKYIVKGLMFFTKKLRWVSHLYLSDIKISTFIYFSYILVSIFWSSCRMRPIGHVFFYQVWWKILPASIECFGIEELCHVLQKKSISFSSAAQHIDYNFLSCNKFEDLFTRLSSIDHNHNVNNCLFLGLRGKYKTSAEE